MKARNVPPLSFAQGWEFVLGGDSLGRSVLARLFVGAQNTLLIASVSTLFSFCAGGLLGLAAGYSNNTVSQLILRVTDVIMSFPSLLLALVVLYLLGSSIANVIIVLGDHPHAGLSAHRAGGDDGDQAPQLRRRRRDARLAALARAVPAYIAAGAADAVHHRRRAVRGGGADRILAQLPRPRRAIAGLHLGLDGGERARLSRHRVVDLVLSRRGDPAHHAVAQHARQLAAHGVRSPVALAPAASGAKK